MIFYDIIRIFGKVYSNVLAHAVFLEILRKQVGKLEKKVDILGDILKKG